MNRGGGSVLFTPAVVVWRTVGGGSVWLCATYCVSPCVFERESCSSSYCKYLAEG